MTRPFPIVISPYDLDARGLLADAALLLGAPAITLLPAPLEGMDAQSVREAAALAPEFQRLITRWSWMQDLWRNAAVRPDFTGIHPAEFILETARELSELAPGSALSSVLRSGVFDSSESYLRALCRDISLGGSQPSVSVPVSIGLSRYAHALDAPLLQPHSRRTGSVVQRLETRATRAHSGLNLLLPRDLEPESILALRDAAAQPLASLHDALSGGAEAAALHEIESVWNHAIRAAAPALRITPSARRGRRLSTIRLTLAAMPLEATLAAAAKASTLAAPRRSVARATPPQSATALTQRPVRILSVRELPWQQQSD